MPRFQYQVRDASGRMDSGVLVAGDVNEASRLLHHDGRAIVDLRAEGILGQTAEGVALFPRRIKRDEVIFFATQLAVMVDTGVTLSEALDAIASSSENPAMAQLIREISDAVKGGLEFSAALERHPRVFSNLFVSMMRVSEATGTMGQMLQRVSEYMQQERETRKKIRGALTYPVCMLAFCVLVVVGLLTFVLPRFEKIYAGKGAVLPAPTRALLAISHGLITYWPFIVMGVTAACVGLFLYLRSPGGRIVTDSLRIRIPLIGGMYRKAYLARSLRTMATMVSGGVSMLEGLGITSRVAGNHYYAQIWSDLAERVKEGSTLSEPLYSCPLVPRTIAQMIAAGEQTGQLGKVMNRVAHFCEEDLKVAVKTMTQMIEPLMIIVMGLVIGGIAIALLLPVFRISKIITQ